MDYEEALEILQPHAEQGDAEAQYRLGTIHSYRLPQKNPEAGFRWYLRAAEQGHMRSQHQVGYSFYYGISLDGVVTRDGKKALAWYLKAAEQGYDPSQLAAADLYRNGEHVKKDMAEALRWYGRAAEQGNEVAQYILGELHERGEDVAKDEAEAAKWYRMGAEQGEPSSAMRLGSLYEDGRGVPQDDREAVRWYREAAQYDNVDPFAQRRLDYLHEQGRASKEDISFEYKRSYRSD